MQDYLKQNYFNALYKRVSTVKFLGEAESRKLKDVFVELTIVEDYERPFRDAEILGFMDTDRRRRYQLFGSDRGDMNKEQKNEKRIIKPNELVRPNRQGIVTGSPGCGKTTLLKYLTGKILNEKKRFPIFLELKTIAQEDLRQANNDLAKFLFVKAILSIVHLSEDEAQELKGIFFKELKANNVVVFLDGFDEVHDEGVFTELCQSIDSFIRSDYGENSLLISTRPYVLNRVNFDLEQMEILPLNQKQIAAFLNAYYLNDNICKKLLSEIKQPNPLSEMVRVPILLSSIVGLYREKQRFNADASQTEIYDAITKRLIAKLDQDKSVRRFAFRIKDTEGTLKLDFLKQLAFERLIMDEPEEMDERREALRLVFTDEVILEKAKDYVKREALQGINPIDLADDVKGTALLREIGEDSYAFAHLTLHEFLAAKVLAKHKDSERLFSRSYFNPSLVEMEILPMTLGLVNIAEPFYKALERLSESLVFANFRLQLRGLVYGARISDERVTKIIDYLLDLIKECKRDDFGYCKQIVHSLTGIKGRHSEIVINRIASLLKNKSLDVRVNAVKALELIIGNRVVDVLTEALNDEEMDVRSFATSALSHRSGEKVVDALIKTLNKENSHIRRTAASALGKKGGEKAVDALINALDDDVVDIRRRAISALAQKGGEKVVDALIKALDDKSIIIRRRAAWALERKGGEKTVDALINALNDEDNEVRRIAASALGKKGGEKAVDALINALDDESIKVRKNAVIALRQIGSKKAVDALIKALDDKSIKVRKIAVSALGQKSSKKAIDVLVKTLRDEDGEIRRRAVSALGQTGNEEVVDVLIEALNDEDIKVRRRAVSALGEKSKEKAIDALIEAPDDENNHIQRTAASALERQQGEKAVDVLIEALNDEDIKVRRRAVSALRERKGEKVVDALIKSLADEDIKVRRRAVSALGRKRLSDKVVDALINALRDEDNEVRRSATSALRQTRSEKIVDVFIKCLEDKNIHVRRIAVSALGEIGNEKAVAALIEALSDEDSSVRGHVARALAIIKDSIFSRPLEKSLKSENNFTQRKAAQFVGYYTLEPKVLEELSNIAENDSVEENRIAAAKAKEMFVYKLALFGISFSEEDTELKIHEQKENLIKTKYAEVENNTNRNQKGKALEELLSALLESVEGFICKSNVRTKTQEIDVVITNSGIHPSWHDGGRLILVECKNWTKKTDRKEFDAFCRKLIGRGGECKYGFFVSLSGFTKDFSQERFAENRNNKWKIIEIDKHRLKQLAESTDRGTLLREFADDAALK